MIWKTTYKEMRCVVVFVSCVVVGLFSHAESKYSETEVIVSSIPEPMRFVGGLFTERIRERTPEPGAYGTFRVRYVLDAAVADEEARVVVKGDTAEIRAGRLRGLVAGTGLLLKSFHYGATSFCPQDGVYDFKPAKSFRMAYLARHFINYYMEADEHELCRYVDDLALDGINNFTYQYEIPVVDAARMTEPEKTQFRRVFKAVYNRIIALDCDFGVRVGSNQMRTDSPEEFRAEPNTNPKCPPTGFNACPAKPRALEALLKSRKKDLEQSADLKIGSFCYWPYDEGGCGCKTCRPWGGNGFLKLIEKFHSMNAAAQPSAKHIVSTWFFDDADYKGLYKYLETHDWVDYVLADDFGDTYPEYPLKHKLPGKVKLITFPEISMWGRVPWGGFGAIALPKFHERLFRQCEHAVDGFRYYSEGNYEDINKAIVTGLYIEPSTTVEAILRRYGSYHFAGADPDDFVRLVELLEKNHRPHLMEKSDTAKAKALALKIDREILPSLRSGWRWRLVYIRAMLDDEIVDTADFQPERAKPYFDELVKLYHAERQLQWVLDGNMGGWTCPKYVPDGHGFKVYAPPQGDATEMVQTLLDDSMKTVVHLGAGDWNVKPLVLRRSRLTLVLEKGCRLNGELTIASNVDGVTVKGDVDKRVRVEKGAQNVVIDGRRVAAPAWYEQPYTDVQAEIRRIDKLLEWADQHAEHEKVAFLYGKLRELKALARSGCGNAKPLFIGISDTCAPSSQSSQWARAGHLAECVRKTGNVPVFVPRMTNTNALAEVVAKLDALILSGGEDVDPALYGATPSPALGRVFKGRDDFDFALMRAAKARRLPMLGVCRGVQALNVFFGGTLWQDLPSEFPVKNVRHSRGDSRFEPVHEIVVERGSRLANLLGEGRIGVNSQHHQAVKDIAPGFRVSARSTDGVIEAVESDDYPAAGVQFHPEDLANGGGDERFLRIFGRILDFTGQASRCPVSNQ
jgi:putative glutamine amidotransferase